MAIIATFAIVLLVLELVLASVGWINTHLLRPSVLPPFIARCADLYLHIVLIALALVGVEFLFPGNRDPSAIRGRHCSGPVTFRFRFSVRISPTPSSSTMESSR